MVTLCDLPNDILFEILTQHGCSERDINAFSQVNHRLHPLAKRCLYRKNASQNRSSALLWASKTGNLATALYALDHGGANINTRTHRSHRETALMVAALYGHEKIAKLLVETPTCIIDAEDSRSRTALSYAVKGNCEEIVQLLIHKGTDLNHQDRSGFTALAIAARLGYATIARLLVRHGADPNLARYCRGRLPLHDAAQKGHEAVVQALLEDDRTYAGHATRNGTTPLYLAVSLGHCGVVKLLLARDDIDVNREGTAQWRPIHWAAFNESVSLVRLFLADPRIDVNAQEHRGWPALFFAVQKGQRTIVKALLSHPMIDPTIKDLDGITALMFAKELGHLDIAALIEASCKEKENTNSIAQR